MAGEVPDGPSARPGTASRAVMESANTLRLRPRDMPVDKANVTPGPMPRRQRFWRVRIGRLARLVNAGLRFSTLFCV